MARSSTPAVGFGLAPLGTSPFGYGTPASAVPIVGRVMDMSDKHRTPGNSRRIDPVTRDYVFDEETGRVLGMTSAQQRVYLALVTQQGSSADSLLGSDLGSLQTVTNNIVTRVQNEVRRALGRLLSEGAIRIVSIDAYADRTRLMTKVVWTDLSDESLNTTEI